MTNPILDLIEQQNVINEKAWVTFNDDFERRNPPPKVHNRNWWFRAVTIGGIASLSVSGSFTIPSFFNVSLATGTMQFIAFFVGFFGFVMVDVMAILGAHKLVDMVYRPQALNGQMNSRVLIFFVATMTGFSFVVGVLSNLYYMMRGFGILPEGSIGLENLSVTLGVFMAFAPPILSIATGAIIALEPLQGIIEREAYETSRNRAWGRFKKKQGINLDIDKLTERYMDNAMNRLGIVPENTFMKVHEQHEQPQKRTETRQEVHDYLDANPEDANLKVRELADKLNLSIGLISGELRDWKRENDFE